MDYDRLHIDNAQWLIDKALLSGTYRDIAAQVGMSASGLNRIRSGQQVSIRPSTLTALARLADIPEDLALTRSLMTLFGDA